MCISSEVKRNCLGVHFFPFSVFFKLIYFFLFICRSESRVSPSDQAFSAATSSILFLIEDGGWRVRDDAGSASSGQTGPQLAGESPSACRYWPPAVRPALTAPSFRDKRPSGGPENAERVRRCRRAAAGTWRPGPGGAVASWKRVRRMLNTETCFF